MLKGLVFNLQTFTSEAFALFIDKFLNGNCGVAKGCALSNTSNSATIGDGYFVIRGRFLQIISGVTVSDITNNGFYSLICEIDLSKTNTVDQLNQAEIKTVYGASNYPTLTQQDITGSGTVYQYEFARFKVENGSITNFTDRRTFIDFESIYDIIEQHIQDIDDGSLWVLKTTYEDDMAEIDSQFSALSDTYVSKTTYNSKMSSLDTQISNLNANKQKNITRGTTAPSGGSNGDIYIQYFN